MATCTIQILHLWLKEYQGVCGGVGVECKDCKGQNTGKAAVGCCLLETAGERHPGYLNSMAAVLRPEHQ